MGIRRALLIFLPLILSTIYLAAISPQEVRGINYRVELNDNPSFEDLKNFSEVLKENGYQVEGPEYEEYCDDYYLKIDFGCSDMYIEGGNGSYILGDICYKFNVLTWQSTADEKTEEMKERIDEVCSLLSLNRSGNEIHIGDNDLYLLHIQAEIFLYSLVISYTISALIAHRIYGKDMKRIYLENVPSFGFFLTVIGLSIIWPIFGVMVSHRFSPICLVCIVIFVLMAAIGIQTMKKDAQKDLDSRH